MFTRNFCAFGVEGFHLAKILNLCPRWYHMVYDGQRWSEMVRDGPNYSEMVPSWWNIVQLGSK